MMIKIGVIGAGNIAHRFSEAVQKGKIGGLLEAIASRDILRAKDYQKEYGYKKAYGDYQSLYEDPDIDLVYVATPHAFHYQQMMDLLDYGKHIICEKSFTLNANQAKAIFDKAKEKNLFVMEAMWTRFLPTVKEVLQVIDQGLIENPMMPHAETLYILGQMDQIREKMGVSYPNEKEGETNG